MLAAASRKKLARAEKKQKAREAALQLPAIAEDNASTSETDKVAATPEAAPQDTMLADAATSMLKLKKKKTQQTSFEQPASPAGPSDPVLADVSALISSSQHPAAVVGKRNKKRNALPGAAPADSSPMTGLFSPMPDAASGSVIAAHPYAEAASGVATGPHTMRRQPSPGIGVPVRPYLPPVETQDESSAGWTVVNGHQRHADPAATHAAIAAPVSAHPEHADVPLGEPAVEDADQNPADDKIGLAAMEGHYPLRKRGVRAGKRHKKRMGIRQAPSEHSDDDSDHTVRGLLMQGQLLPSAGESSAYGVLDASNSPRDIGLPPGLAVGVNRQAEHNLRQAKKANALQAAQAAEAAKQEAVQRAHAAAETRRQAEFMAVQEPAEDWPALSASGSSSGQLANMHDALVQFLVTIAIQ